MYRTVPRDRTRNVGIYVRLHISLRLPGLANARLCRWSHGKADGISRRRENSSRHVRLPCRNQQYLDVNGLRTSAFPFEYLYHLRAGDIAGLADSHRMRPRLIPVYEKGGGVRRGYCHRVPRRAELKHNSCSDKLRCRVPAIGNRNAEGERADRKTIAQGCPTAFEARQKEHCRGQ